MAFYVMLICSSVAVRDISAESLAACLSALTMSHATTFDDDPSPCRSDTVRCCCAAAAINNSEVDINAENSAADSIASCSRADTKSVSLPSDSETVTSVLCLLHGLSHCSYHEPSLLVLAEHAAYDAAVDLFVYLWNKLQASRQQDDKIQACIFVVHV